MFLQRKYKMEKYFATLAQSPLFAGIEASDLSTLLSCLSAKVYCYNKNDVIFSVGEKVTSIGFVLSGNVHILQEDFWGNRTILANAAAGSTFAEAFVSAQVSFLPVSVIAADTCEIMMLDYAKIIKTCPSACSFHNTLVKNMLRIMAQKNVTLTLKIEHVTKRNTREKLLSYLSSQVLQCKSKTFAIPFNRQALADYLAVDRSALSSELSKLQKEGVLTYKKNIFELKHSEDS